MPSLQRRQEDIKLISYEKTDNAKHYTAMALRELARNAYGEAEVTMGRAVDALEEFKEKMRDLRAVAEEEELEDQT